MNRRQLLASSMFGLAAPMSTNAAETGVKPLPDPSLLAADPEKYWLRVREEQFFLPGWRNFLNNGSLGVAPRPVVGAVEDFLEHGAALLSDEYPRWGYETLDEERAEMAAFLGCKKDELAFTHCATDSLSTIAAGIDLKPGDEVVMTDLEHPSGKAGWAVRAARHGISVREVKIPLPPKSPEQLADIMISAIGPKTRVLFFSGIISPIGIVMPVRQICDAARAKGVISAVDGAHMNGQIPLKLSELGCDYYAGSPHKWMFAPAGSGILYIREENLGKLWPSIVTGGWDDKASGASRFMKIGTNNRAVVVGMMAGLRFLKALGPENVYARIHDLARRNYKMAASRPHLELFSGADERLYGSLVTIGFRGAKLEDLWRKARERKIWVYGSERLRLSTHIHTRPQDLEAFYSLVDDVIGGKKA
ncbi:MAG: aminotransferase class V-fold PLP-dependent enzyme [Acidobacteria bacterium]|nr:aminotransferase class V-fold PLP-dependent enzyme [Acidobacteriota bacterium]